MLPAGIKPAIPASERPQGQASDRAATVIGRQSNTNRGRRVAVATSSVRCHLFIGRQYETCFTTPFWRLEFRRGSQTFGNFLHPV
jgi:hypothetical protein